MSALVVMMLLFFMLIIALSLTVWMALTLRGSARDATAVRREDVEATPPAPARIERSNDEVRGARVIPPRKRRTAPDDDAFESFFNAGNDDVKF